LDVGGFGEVGLVVGALEFGSQAFVFGVMELDVGIFEGGLFGAGEFSGNEVGYVGEFELGVEFDEVRVYLAGAVISKTRTDNRKERKDRKQKNFFTSWLTMSISSPSMTRLSSTVSS